MSFAGRRFSASWAQAGRMPDRAGEVMRATVEAEARDAAAHAVDLARQAVEAFDDDRLGDALELIVSASEDAQEAMSVGWSWWLDKMRRRKGAP